MTLSDFLNKNKIKLSLTSLSLCNQALNIMNDSKDPLHDLNHVKRILDYLHQFLKNEARVKKDLNFEVLILSICWHDTWKSERFSNNIIAFLFHNFWEGIGSMRLFGKVAKKAKLDKNISKKVKYAIRKHHSFQIRKRKTLEAKILMDLDVLDVWSMERLKVIEKMLSEFKIGSRILKLVIFYYKRYMLKKDETRLNFKWSRKEFKKRKTLYTKEVQRLIKEQQNYLTLQRL